MRRKDGINEKPSYTPKTGLGAFQLPGKANPLGPHWGSVTPFVLKNTQDFRFPGPPPLTGARYAQDFNEVKAIGAKNSTQRTVEQTAIGILWEPPGRRRLAKWLSDLLRLPRHSARLGLMAREFVVKHRDDITHVANLPRNRGSLTGYEVHLLVASRAAARRAQRVVKRRKPVPIATRLAQSARHRQHRHSRFDLFDLGPDFDRTRPASLRSHC